MNTEQPDVARCRACIYWKKLSGAGYSQSACHFLLEAHRARRKDANGACLEFQKNTCKLKHTGFMLAPEEIS